LTDCINISDEGVILVHQFIRQIEELYIKNTPKITGTSCGYFALLKCLKKFVVDDNIRTHMSQLFEVHCQIRHEARVSTGIFETSSNYNDKPT